MQGPQGWEKEWVGRRLLLDGPKNDPIPRCPVEEEALADPLYFPGLVVLARLVRLLVAGDDGVQMPQEICWRPVVFYL